MRRQPHVIFGQNIYRLRLAAGLTQEGLADKAGLSRRFISDVERGLKSPGVASIVQLKMAFGCGFDELFAGTDRKK